MSKKRVLRIVPELRNYHVAESEHYGDSEIFYFTDKYDLQGDVPSHIRKITFAEAVRLVWRGGYSTLIIWEPLWVRMLPRHVVLGLLWKLRGPRRPVRSYAMENNDLPSLIGGDVRTPNVVTAVFALLVGLYVRFVYDRMAFASPGSQRAYSSLYFFPAVPQRVFPSLPARRAVYGPQSVSRAIFAGRLERRKGVAPLMQAWEVVEESMGEVQLVLTGGGPLEAVVEKWAMIRPERRIYRGHVPHSDLVEEIARATVLVLPSIREGRWREQIGLPIHEGLMHGLTIVTTDETGLADWLTERGHHVVPVARIDDGLADAIQRALSEPLDPVDVVDSLPAQHGRIQANKWLEK